MYLYSLSGYEENVVITHEKKFTQDEFTKMCLETPTLIHHDGGRIAECLEKNYGFKQAEYTADFDTSGF
jgi:hypothetical protein